MSFDTALADFNPGQLKTWIKWPLKLIYDYLLMLFCLAYNKMPDIWPTCVQERYYLLHLKIMVDRYPYKRLILEHSKLLIGTSAAVPGLTT